MRKYYKAEMDRHLRVTTRVIWFLFVLPPCFLVFAWYRLLNPGPGCVPLPHVPAGLLPWLLPAFAALIGLTAYVARAMAPKGYAVDDLELRIDRDMLPITIPLREIAEVKLLEDGLLGRSARLLGTSGFYGHYGLFWNSELGRFRAYATRLNRLAAVRTKKTLFVLSPDDPEDFVRTLGGLLR